MAIPVDSFLVLRPLCTFPSAPTSHSPALAARTSRFPPLQASAALDKLDLAPVPLPGSADARKVAMNASVMR
jgi:hypothetical protein